MELSREALRAVRAAAIPIEEEPDDYDSLLFRIGDAQVVLIGEASHGTHEFYRERARITRRLIEERGFSAVAIEGDWPDAYQVNRFVRGDGAVSAEHALRGFSRFPSWMWRNRDVLGFLDWLARHNRGRRGAKVGFYGLDLYSLYGSIEAVLAYLDETDPAAAVRARERYSCFERFGSEPQEYGLAAVQRAVESCEDAVVRQLEELRAGGDPRFGPLDEDERFYAEQNARLVRNAERYYRAMFRGSVESWNLRDSHMMETLEILLEHLGREVARPKLVVWAHNSHLGDARATEFADQGELNLGQLCRVTFGEEMFSIGFTTYSGTVTAAQNWDEPPEKMTVRPALKGSVEALFHEVGLERFLIGLRAGSAAPVLATPMLERAIGVVYRPHTERQSHYFVTRLSEQFDAVIHLEQTRAVDPLERGVQPAVEPPETYPSAL